MLQLLLFVLSLAIVVKSADYALKYSGRIAFGLNISSYVVGFLLIALISILPETFIAVASAIQGQPAFGLGTLFGSNVADLTLIFALVIFISRRNISVESRILKRHILYLLVLAVPLFFGLNGHYSRPEGIILILIGAGYYGFLLSRERKQKDVQARTFSWAHFGMLLASMAALLIASNFTVKFGVSTADVFGLNPVLVGMFIAGLGSTLPELFFSAKAVRKHQDGLAMGDLLGTVISDATIVVGILAVIHPFAFSQRIVYITGAFMLVAATILLYCMRTGRTLTRREGYLLVGFYILFVLTEYLVNTTFPFAE